MNETAKTGIFVGVAAVLVLVAWFNRTNVAEPAKAEMRNQLLFPGFKNALDAASLEVVDYDESTATVRPFKVAQIQGRWSIPSHDNYPTDAKDQLATAAGSLLNLKVLDVASDARGDHSLYGVLDPDPKTLPPGATGVGTRVTIRDRNDKVLLSMIVGKAVPGREGLRYVRAAGKDQVYTMELKTDKLSAKFADWIEKDLLKLNTMDIKRVDIDDYSIDINAGRQVLRGELALGYDDRATNGKWKLIEDKGLKGEELVANTMAPDEELNTTVLDDLKTALGDLKIVDVNRKPTGLSADLESSGTIKLDPTASASLADRGFYLVRAGKGVGLVSDQGEIRVGMKDGVDYVLRFGQIAGSGEAKSKDKDGKKDGSASPGVNRYLFVMTEFNPKAIPEPVLEKVPDAPKADEKADDKKADEKKADDKADAKKDDAKKPAAEKKDPKAERERIEKENKRKQDEYDRQVKEGKEHVKKLNARFADWYYVIADDVYQKIHLGRQKIVKKKEKKAEGKDQAGHDHAANDHAEGDHAEGDAAKKDGFTPADFDSLKQSPPKANP